ncbi:AB hydrolase superfamily protein YisY [Geobacter sp. OR-1]|uniref:alpha/beta fold hydrolase n=1 Tax=Geobacter sp. OR-1 TaxID=1266765 RepID=UPI000543F194|nr:alpha/beta fold hydrolase [Geobacter sp. OR-1]GAM09777.1 AB hydrolase superfamily protein YisY [Geobacter sp. OR-1]
MQAFVNGIALGYDDTGEGVPILLIHGFPLCRKMWRPQVNKLPLAGFRVIAPDLRGFGESDAPEGPYSMDIFADDLIGLLDYLEIERAVIGGMSMGGYVLFNLVERYPERVKGAIFITTRATPDDETAKARRLQLAAEVRKLGPQMVADPFASILFAPGTEQERPKLVEEVYGWMAANDSRGLAGGLLAMRERKDYSAALGSFNIPALAIGAELDQAAPPATSTAIAAGIPGCRLCIVPSAGHLANLEDVKTFNSCVLEFLSSLG